MQAFAELLDSLSFQPARNAKLRLIETYMRAAPDPDRGWALAALTGGLDFPAAKPALLRGFGEDKIGADPFHLSHDYVGDLAETLALIWETDPAAGPPPSLGEVVETLQRATKMPTPAILKRWLAALDSTGRWALLKLLTGALRVGVSARLAKPAPPHIGGHPLESLGAAWHGLPPPFARLQRGLIRSTVTPKRLKEHPAHARLDDALWLEGDDLRARSFDERRARLEAWMAKKPRQRFDISPLVTFRDWTHLAELREAIKSDGIEGLMLKRGDSAYLAGRPKGPWFKWKRDPMLADCVMMYAQRGHGKRSSFYSDFTFGCWREADGKRELAPVGKAYFGFTDEELRWLDKWVRDHPTNRFGPVREVSPDLVLEIAFDGIARSTRP